MRVLVVEDELAARRGLVSLLKELDSRIEVVGEAADGVRGLAQLQALMPDVAFIDIRMPEMDGLEMVRRAQESGLQVQYVIVSAFAEFEYARQALTLGVRDYLLKPVTRENLANVVRPILPDLAQIPSGAPHHPKVDRVLKIIREEYRTPINLTSLSEQLQISPEYISYLFHRDMGVNFSTYLRQFRIDRAYELMNAGNTKVYEIAHAAGFSDVKYFCRVFREVTGKSPGAYLRELETLRET